MGTVGAQAFFGTVCGAVSAATAAFSVVAYPEMKRYNYDRGLATATIAASSTLAVLIPPSLSFIIYGIEAEQSIGRLFLAGIIPGLLLVFMFIFTIYLLVRRNPQRGPAGPGATVKEKVQALFSSAGEVLAIFAIVMGGFFAGLFTPTEAGAIGAFAVLVVALIRRKMNWARFKNSVTATVGLTAMIFLLIAGAKVFGRFIVVSGLPEALTTWVVGLPVGPLVIMVVMLIVLFILGMFIDTLALLLLSIPIFFPVAMAIGFDPIAFGVIMVVAMGTGQMSPPVAITVFIVSGIIKEVPMWTTYKAIMPFLAAKVIHLVLVVVFPQLSIWLPNLIKGPM
jgi:tripartite ATP-independent transporter DctM subunit